MDRSAISPTGEGPSELAIMSRHEEEATGVLQVRNFMMNLENQYNVNHDEEIRTARAAGMPGTFFVGNRNSMLQEDDETVDTQSRTLEHTVEAHLAPDDTDMEARGC